MMGRMIDPVLVDSGLPVDSVESKQACVMLRWNQGHPDRPPFQVPAVLFFCCRPRA